MLIVVDQNFIRNDRHEAHSVFFDKAPLNAFLASQDQDEFEFGISALLHQLNLSPIHFTGMDRLTDGPDILAYSNAGHIYVIECTIAEPNNKGKLFKLHMRTEVLREHYKRKGYNVELIRPVLFTSLSQANTVAHRDSAANFQISLVSREGIDALLSRVSNPPSPQEMFESAIAAIPETKSKELQAI